jgi:hypothetical protein
MLYIEAAKHQFSGHVDVLTIQTLAGFFTIKELIKGDQLGQLIITSDLPLTVARDGNSIIVGTVNEIGADWVAQNALLTNEQQKGS